MKTPERRHSHLILVFLTRKLVTNSKKFHRTSSFELQTPFRIGLNFTSS